MFQPRRLPTRRGLSVEAIARKPSHLTSQAQAPRVGSLRTSRAWVPVTR
jgi:hypothetical protein